MSAEQASGKTGGQRAVFGLALYTGTNALLSALKFLLIPVYTRFLTPHQYGILGTVNIIALFLVLSMNLCLERAVAREYFDYRENRLALATYLKSILLFLAAWTFGLAILAACIGIPLSGWLARQIEIPFFPYVAVALGTGCATVFYSLIMTLLQVREEPVHFALAQIARFLIMVAFALALVIGRRAGALGVLSAELISTGGMAVVLACLFLPRLLSVAAELRAERPAAPVRVPLNREMVRRALVYGLPFVLFELGGWVLTGSDRLIMAKFLNLSDVGLYSLGASLAQGLNVFTNAVNTAYVPFFFRTARDHSNPQSVFSRVSEAFVFLVGGLCLAGVLFAEPVLRIIAPPAYLGALPVFRILLISSFLWGLYSITILPLLHLKETGRLPVFISISMLVSFGGNLALVPTIGIMGAACSSVLAYGTLFSIAFHSAARQYPIHYDIVSFWGVMVLFVVAGGLVCTQPIPVRAVVFVVVVAAAAMLQYWRRRTGLHWTVPAGRGDA